eukprot:scaffold40948_cov44-Attheya_sp.AAC.1
MGTGDPSSAATRLRKLLSRQVAAASAAVEGRHEEAVALAGVHDALSAKVFAKAGAKALFLSGFGVSATRLGEPDAGILTLTEMEDAARNVIRAAGPTVPVIVDGDTGYGSAVNVRRTIRGLAAAGAAAITVEDQWFPKRCTFAAGRGVRVVSRAASVARIQAAVAARNEARESDHDVLLVARTDCRAALGLDEAVARCQAFEAAGADIVYAEGLQSQEEYIHLRQCLQPTTPMILAQLQTNEGNHDNSNKQEIFTTRQVGEMGYSLALFGVTALQAYVQTLETTARAFLDSDGVLSKEDDATQSLSSFSNLKRVVGFSE